MRRSPAWLRKCRSAIPKEALAALERRSHVSKTSNRAGLNASQLEGLKNKLLEARTQLASRRSQQLEARSELDAEVGDEADAAVRAHDEDALALLSESEHTRLAEIDHALSKFATGEYGLDEDSGEPIDYARLSVLPWARLAAHNQEELERRGHL